MSDFFRSSTFRLAAVLVSAGLLLAGCAATGVLRPYRESPHIVDLALRSVLDRSDMWRSLSAQLKVKIRARDVQMRAKGHILFLSGERYELGFSKPYDRYIGTLYITPEQFVHWDLAVSAKVYPSTDTLRISRIIAADLPNWDPRDLLPFPVSGRTGGFQTDSTWRQDKFLFISGQGDGAGRTLKIAGDDGRILEEVIDRPDRDRMIKRFSRHVIARSWPVARIIECQDAERSMVLKWSLSNIELSGGEFVPASIISDTSKSEPTP